MKSSALLILAVAGLALNPPSSCAQGGFRPGDIYLHSAALIDTSGTGGGLMRIDPYTGATQLLVQYAAKPGSFQGTAAYDPYRDRILVYAGIGTATVKLYRVDAAGAAVDMGVPVQCQMLAPRGDGIVYFRSGAVGAGMGYLDLANTIHPLLDAAGIAPYAFPGGASSISSMIFHPTQNALFAATPWGASLCPGGDPLHLSIHRLPLSGDGTRVVGPVTCAQAVVDPAGVEGPVNWSLMPSGELMLVVDTNSNAQQPRMQAIDPVTLVAAPFAWNGPYPGAATTNAGIFCTAQGAALVLDTSNDVLRRYPAGAVGNGTTFATGVSCSAAWGEVATMLEIEPAGISTSLRANTGSISLTAGGTQTLDFNPGAAFAGSVYLVGGSTTGWTPGIAVGGFVVPLVYDWYTDYTIWSANLGPLFDNLGILGGAGAAQAQLVVPPNAPPMYSGLTVFHAAVAFAPGLVLAHASNPVALTLTP